jgi:hypothetical protein
MTYISQVVMPLYTFNQFLSTTCNGPDINNAQNVFEVAEALWEEVASRVAAVGVSIIVSACSVYGAILGVKDLVELNILLLVARGFDLSAYYTLNVAYIKTLALAVGAIFFAIITPRHVYTDLKALNVIEENYAQVLVQLPESLQHLASKINVALDRLPDGGQRLLAWREELPKKMIHNMPTSRNRSQSEYLASSFFTLDYQVFKPGFREFLLDHYAHDVVNRVLPANSVQDVFQTLVASILNQGNNYLAENDPRAQQHRESTIQFRKILFDALKKTRQELQKGSDFDHILDELGKMRRLEKSEVEITAYLKQELIERQGRLAPQDTIEQHIKRLEEMQGEVRLLQSQKNKENEIEAYLLSLNIEKQLETPEQALTKAIQQTTYLRIEVAKMRQANKSQEEIQGVLRQHAFPVEPSKTAGEMVNERLKSLDELKKPLEKMRADGKQTQALVDFLARHGVKIGRENPEQAIERALLEARRLKERISGYALEQANMLLVRNKIPLAKDETPEEAVSRAKKEMCYTNDEIATMQNGAYAAMLDRAILEVVETSYVDEHEALVLSTEPQDLRLSRTNNIFGVYEVLKGLNEQIQELSRKPRDMRILRRLLLHKDFNPSSLSGKIEPSSLKTIKDLYRDIVAFRLDPIDKRILTRSIDDVQIAEAFAT